MPRQQIPTCYEISDASKDADTDTRRHYQIERGSERNALSFFLLHGDGMKCGRRFFAEPSHPRQRMYEALRAYFLEGRSSQEVAGDFGYTAGSFRVLCHAFRREREPQFFVSPTPGPREQPKKAKAHDLVIALRKQNHSVYEIAEALKERALPLSPTAVREVLRAEGFAPLPRRLDEERPAQPGPTVEPVADVRCFALKPGTQYATRLGGLFLFLPDLVRLEVARLAAAAKLPGSVMIPAQHALRAALALKLWSIERKSHVMALVADPGLALFCGLNAIPKKSYLAEYSSRLDHAKTTRLLAAWHRAVAKDSLFPGASFNLDFHSVPCVNCSSSTWVMRNRPSCSATTDRPPRPR